MAATGFYNGFIFLITTIWLHRSYWLVLIDIEWTNFGGLRDSYINFSILFLAILLNFLAQPLLLGTTGGIGQVSRAFSQVTLIDPSGLAKK